MGNFIGLTDYQYQSSDYDSQEEAYWTCYRLYFQNGKYIDAYFYDYSDGNGSMLYCQHQMLYIIIYAKVGNYYYKNTYSYEENYYQNDVDGANIGMDEGSTVLNIYNCNSINVDTRYNP